ncbi:putative DNA repair protein RadA [Rosa chinensis]|uniref:Putative DNA repair protein RadA n=1 Tax=Rosa chinensis TaxID=74649 RepID=A0A2P6RXJ0_ROSCH|nr:putative DNA repair protein RadA [Rosa chinensis]
MWSVRSRRVRLTGALAGKVRSGTGSVSGIRVSEKVRSWLPSGKVKPVRLNDVNWGISWKDWRIPLHGTLEPLEVKLRRCLVVALYQIAALIAERHELGKASRVLNVSGEESIEQIGSKADRMGIKTEDLFLYSSTDIEDILEESWSLAPQALIADSIQTVHLKGVTGSPGGIVQVKECTSALLRFAKRTNIPVFLIGHETKSGEIAGPRLLEHIVDVVLYIEEEALILSFTSTVKNRFGSTDEV